MERPSFSWNPKRLNNPDNVPYITKKDFIAIQVMIALFILGVHLYLVWLPVQPSEG